MKIVIPMAGRGTRLRPQTLTVPKPLLPIAGKPMILRLVEDLTASLSEKISEIAFVVGDFGKEVEEQLIQIAAALGAKGSIYYQDQPLGTGHAILCAADSLEGPCIVAFSDTLFKADFKIDTKKDGIIWVKKVDDPSSFGVVRIDENNVITEFVEKSPVFVSDLAITGIYYFRDGQALKEELQFLVDNDIKDKGEYQLTSAMENMRAKGWKFEPAEIEEWLDCGNKNNVLNTNKRFLELKTEKEKLIADSAVLENSVIILPCFIGEQVTIKNSVLGPNVCIGNNSKVQSSVIENSIIHEHSSLKNCILENSMVGSEVEYMDNKRTINLGDYTKSRAE